MKNIILLAVIFFAISTNAQDVVKKADLKYLNGLYSLKRDNSLFSGKVATYFSNGNVESLRYFNEGKQTGKVEIFFDSGVMRVSTFEDSNKINYGEVTIWNEDSSIAFSGKWLDGKLIQHGNSTPFTGKITVYYKNGNINEESEFKNGQWNGKQIFLDRNGKVTSECIFENSKIVE